MPDFMKYAFTFLILILLFSCKSVIEPDLPEVLFDNYKSSVVLISNQYYYEVTIDGDLYYYSPGSEEKIFTTEEDVWKNLSHSTGTGFIISENGEIITNNHVVNPKDESYIDEFIRYFDSKKIFTIQNLSICKTKIEDIENRYVQYSDYMDSSEKDSLQSDYELILNLKDEWLNYYQTISNYNVNNSSSKIIVYKLGIAFNSTLVNGPEDLQECIVVKLSENKKVDLALIQTKSNTFDSEIGNIFNFIDNNPNIVDNPDNFIERDITNPVKVNDDVFMIGYNNGFSLANTELGIKPQFTSGKISQECDGVRILYTIPTLTGSSGSPVIDKWGNLIGVNFAGLAGSQSFNFAVPVFQLKKFYEE